MGKTAKSMKKERHEIVKLPKASSTTDATPLSSYAVRTIEIFKSIIISIEITKEAIRPMIISLIGAAIIISGLIVGKIAYGFDQPLSKLPGFSANNVELTADYYRQTVLSDYFKTMTEALLIDNPKLIQQKSGIFRALTQSTLQELDPERKRYLVMFLQDVNLLQVSSRTQPSLLLGANLTGANLQGINLRYANLQGTNLSSADLRGSDLRGANLANAILTNSCYDNQTFFDKKFQPDILGMREVTTAQKCS